MTKLKKGPFVNFTMCYRTDEGPCYGKTPLWPFGPKRSNVQKLDEFRCGSLPSALLAKSASPRKNFKIGEHQSGVEFEFSRVILSWNKSKYFELTFSGIYFQMISGKERENSKI